MARTDIARTGNIKSNTTWSSELQVSPTATTLVGLFGSCKASSDQYVMIFDSSSSVSDGTSPSIHPMNVRGGDNFHIEIPVRGMDFENGVYVALSTTNSTLTKGSSDVWFTAITV